MAEMLQIAVHDHDVGSTLQVNDDPRIVHKITSLQGAALGVVVENPLRHHTPYRGGVGGAGLAGRVYPVAMGVRQELRNLGPRQLIYHWPLSSWEPHPRPVRVWTVVRSRTAPVRPWYATRAAAAASMTS